MLNGINGEHLIISFGLNRFNVDQLAKPTYRSRYAHTPFGSAPIVFFQARNRLYIL